jgi:hypothetical protein
MKKAVIQDKYTVWLNIYDSQNDAGARGVFTTERDAREAAGPMADHVAIPCELIPMKSEVVK